MSGITPILILIDSVPAFWQAVPPALVTIIIGLNGVFQWKENYLRFGYAEQALESEKFRYEMRSSNEYGRNLKDTTALDRFVTHVDNIVMGEAGEWRVLMQEVKDTRASE